MVRRLGFILTRLSGLGSKGGFYRVLFCLLVWLYLR